MKLSFTTSSSTPNNPETWSVPKDALSTREAQQDYYRSTAVERVSTIGRSVSLVVTGEPYQGAVQRMNQQELKRTLEDVKTDFNNVVTNSVVDTAKTIGTDMVAKPDLSGGQLQEALARVNAAHENLEQNNAR